MTVHDGARQRGDQAAEEDQDPAGAVVKHGHESQDHCWQHRQDSPGQGSGVRDNQNRKAQALLQGTRVVQGRRKLAELGFFHSRDHDDTCFSGVAY